MGAVPGIAGSTQPEQDGIFVRVSESDVDYLPHPIPRPALTLIRRERPPHPSTPGDAYRSEVTITFDD